MCNFTGLSNGSYLVTPTKAGYLMVPKSEAVTINGAHATANFSSIRGDALAGR